MKLLVAINNNLHEWKAALHKGVDAPRLPLVYATGAAFIARGHRLNAVDISNKIDRSESPYPFGSIYHLDQLKSAMESADIDLLWGGLGIRAIIRQLMISPPRRRVLLLTYVWNPGAGIAYKNKKLDMSARISAFFSKGVVVMTNEQAMKARHDLPASIPVLKMRCGVDTQFYRNGSSIDDVPKQYRKVVEQLLPRPFVLMLGDELRCNQDAIDIVERSGLQVVRVSQYAEKSRVDLLKLKIADRKLSDRIIVFERISYPFVRFLLHRASAYAGLVDATWQPAGWTVACEALASGLPIVMYEGLVSRELSALGAPDDMLRVVRMRDSHAFQAELESIIASGRSSERTLTAREFAAHTLDLETTGLDFVQQVERAFDVGHA